MSTLDSIEKYMLGQHLLTHEQEFPWCRHPQEFEMKETPHTLNRHYRQRLERILATQIQPLSAGEQKRRGLQELQGNARLLRAVSFEALDMAWSRINGMHRTGESALASYRDFLQYFLDKGHIYTLPGHPLYDRAKHGADKKPAAKSKQTKTSRKPMTSFQLLDLDREPEDIFAAFAKPAESSIQTVSGGARSDGQPEIRSMEMTPTEKKALAWLLSRDPRLYSFPEAVDPPAGLVREYALDFRVRLNQRLEEYDQQNIEQRPPVADFRRELVTEIAMEWSDQMALAKDETSVVDFYIRQAGFKDVNELQKATGPEWTQAIHTIMEPATHTIEEERRRMPALEQLLIEALLDGSPERLKSLEEIAKIWNGLANRYNIPWSRRPRLGLVRIAAMAQMDPLYRKDRSPAELRREQETGIQTSNSLQEQLYVS